MKIVSKITSLVLALTLLCTMATPAFAASKGPNTRAQYAAMVSEETGIPAITTAEFLQKMDAASEFFRLVTGDRFPTKENINVSFDENLVELNTYIVLNSGLDIIAIAESLPEIGSNAELIANGFEADPAELRDAFYKMSDDYRAHGNDSMATTCRLLGGYLGVVEKLYFYTVQTENPDIYELYLEVTFKDGATENVGTALLINKNTGEIYGRKGNGILGIGFNFNAKEMMVYALINSWHRSMGYAVFYDKMAELIPVWDIITRRYYFDYNGLEWLIQAWKGSYILISNGAEIGVYNRVPGEELGTFYNCATDDQLMDMTMKLSHKDTVLLDLGPQKHWWINGFKLNGMSYVPESLTLEFSIKMPDMEMVNAFVEAIENEENGDTIYTIDGLKVTVNW